MDDSQSSAGSQPAQPQPDSKPSWKPAVAVAPGWSTAGSFAAVGLLVIAVFYTLYFASNLLIPIFAAIILNLVLSPVVRTLEGWHVPPAAGAVLVLVGSIVAFLVGLVTLSAPAAEWADQLPKVLSEVDRKIAVLRQPIEELRRASSEVEKAVTVNQPAEGAFTVEVRSPSLLTQAFGTAQQIGFHIGICTVLLFFFLASGDLFKEKLIRVIPRLTDKKRALVITREIEQEVSNYLFTITVINVVLGIVVGTALHLSGMPNAALWGTMAALLNFVPYFGAILGVLVVGFVAIISFDNVYYALLPPSVYAAINMLEGHIVTPMILGRRLTLSPAVIFVSVIMWGWLWGVPGALMAVPLLVIVKVVFDHFEALAPMGEFLGGRSARPD